MPEAPEFEPCIGLEIHAELKTKTKVFCSCPVTYGAPPNTAVCPVCLGLPGSLPVLNKKALEIALKVALAFNCQIPKVFWFDRKNYYYPDLPKGYQISQHHEPLGREGYVEFEVDGRLKRVRIHDVHLEEDTGKLLHGEEAGVPGASLVDYNRSGVPLLEIVTYPDMHSLEEVEAFMRTIRDILRYLDASDCRMELGQLRFEANISLRPKGSEELGTRVEIKNLNSFKAVLTALRAEIERQTKILREGGKVVQQTMLLDESRGLTRPMRSKEYAEDYRYFPEPDLVPVAVDEEWLSRLKAEIPELPLRRKRRFVEQYGLPEYQARRLTEGKAWADYFEECVRAGAKPKEVADWMLSDLARLLNEAGVDIAECKVSPERLSELISLVEGGEITGPVAKQVLREMFETGRSAREIVEEKGLRQVSDEEALSKVVEEVISENQDAVRSFLGGKDRAIGFLVGQVMRKTKGQANPRVVNELLRKRLEALKKGEG